jgi:alkylhydroperoxidase/carboxymuconolactone decarboxylase family protein YurZ
MSISRQWLGMHVDAALNMHATAEEILDALFSL